MTNSPTNSGSRPGPSVRAGGAAGVAAWTTPLFGIVAVIGVSLSIASVPGATGVLGAGLMLLTMAIAVIDWRNFIIPDWLNAVGFGLGIIHAVVVEPEAMVQAVTIATVRAAVLSLIFLALRECYALVRGRQGLGLGDVKLAGVAGAWLDWLVIPIAIELAAFTALSAYAVRILRSRQSVRLTHRLPFGLFLAPAIWVCWLLSSTLLIRS